MHLSIGLMPAVDIAPILVAAERGYFADENLDLEFSIYASAQDRQSSLQAGAIDGALTDLVALCVNVSAGFKIKATMMTDGMFAIVARPGYEPGNKASIGLMEVSVTNFLADRWLGATFSLDKVYINDIGARLEAVANGQTDLGVFPEPLASVARSRGMAVIASSTQAEFSPQVMVFTELALNEKADAIRAFHKAYDRAVTAIASDPGLARELLIRHIPNVDPALKDAMRLPLYRPAALPDDAFLALVVEWTAKATGRDLSLGAADLFDRRFTER